MNFFYIIIIIFVFCGYFYDIPYYYNNCTIDAPNDESDKSLTSILNSIEADDSIPHYIYEFYKKLSKKSEKYAGKETELINKCLKESIEDFKMSNKKK